MSLSSTRSIFVKRVLLPIPGEGRSVACLVNLVVTQSPDDPVTGVYQSRFDENLLVADTYEGLMRKLRKAAAALPGKRWFKFLDPDLATHWALAKSTGYRPVVIDAPTAKEVSHGHKRRDLEKNRKGRTSYSAQARDASRTYKGEIGYVPDTAQNRAKLAKIQDDVRRAINDGEERMKKLAESVSTAMAEEADE